MLRQRPSNCSDPHVAATVVDGVYNSSNKTTLGIRAGISHDHSMLGLRSLVAGVEDTPQTSNHTRVVVKDRGLNVSDVRYNAFSADDGLYRRKTATSLDSNGRSLQRRTEDAKLASEKDARTQKIDYCSDTLRHKLQQKRNEAMQRSEQNVDSVSKQRERASSLRRFRGRPAVSPH